jgi:hypothetical protein
MGMGSESQDANDAMLERFHAEWNHESALYISFTLSHFRTANRFPLHLEML